MASFVAAAERFLGPDGFFPELEPIFGLHAFSVGGHRFARFCTASSGVRVGWDAAAGVCVAAARSVGRSVSRSVGRVVDVCETCGFVGCGVRGVRGVRGVPVCALGPRPVMKVL